MASIKIREVSKKIKKKGPSKLKTKELPRLYLDYSETQTGGDIVPGQENASFPSFTDKYTDITFHYLSRHEPKKFFKHSIEVSSEVFNLEEAYLAVIRYSDGDTFGSSYGNWHVIGIFPSIPLAKKAIINAKKTTNIYKPWEGHFASYENSEIYRLKILDLGDDQEVDSEDIKIFM